MTDRRTYASWRNMRDRCTNPHAANYHRYGGRGVTVCERWLTYAAFVADMGIRPPHTTLDRIDNARGYQPDNCRWATARDQGRNRRVVKLTAADIYDCLGGRTWPEYRPEENSE